MEFYNFSPSCSSRYVSAIELLNESEATFLNCGECGFEDLIDWFSFNPIFLCESITKNRVLPDLIMYGGKLLYSVGSWFIVSKEAKSFVENNAISGVTFVKIQLVFKYRKSIQSLDSDYYIMQINGRAQLDYVSMNVSCKICPICAKYAYSDKYLPLNNPNGVYPALLDYNSWDKSDIFNHGDCTEEVYLKLVNCGLKGIDLLPFAEKYSLWTNKHYINLR